MTRRTRRRGTPYAAGRRLEWALQRALTQAGFLAVRSAGSHGLVDVVALRGGMVFQFQCKRDGKVTRQDRVRLERVEVQTGRPVFVVRTLQGELWVERLLRSGSNWTETGWIRLKEFLGH